LDQVLTLDLDLDHPAFVGEFEGVRHEVQEDLLEAVGVAVDALEVARLLGVDGQLRLDVFLHGEELQGLEGVHDGAGEVKEAFVQLERLSLLLGQVQQVVN